MKSDTIQNKITTTWKSTKWNLISQNHLNAILIYSFNSNLRFIKYIFEWWYHSDAYLSRFLYWDYDIIVNKVYHLLYPKWGQKWKRKLWTFKETKFFLALLWKVNWVEVTIERKRKREKRCKHFLDEHVLKRTRRNEVNWH